MLLSIKGHTLIELLVSLSILSLLLLFPMITLSKLHQPNAVDYIAFQVKEDFLLAQHIAMTHGRTTYVKVSGGQYYTIRFSVYDEYMRRSFQHDDMYFSSVSMGVDDISFTPSGNPRKSGTIQLTIDGRIFQYTIYIGKGRIYYREL